MRAVERVYATVDRISMHVHTRAPKLARTHHGARTQIRCLSCYYVGARIAAVALFGSPSSEFSSMLAGGAQLPTVGPGFRTKTIDLCIPGDPICSAGADMTAHVSYVPSGMANQAATFVASKVDQINP